MGVFFEGILTIVLTAIVWCLIMGFKSQKIEESKSKVRETQEDKLKNSPELERLAVKTSEYVKELMAWKSNTVELVDNQKVYVIIKVKEYFLEVSTKTIDHELPSPYASNYDLQCHIWLWMGSTDFRTIKYAACGFDRIAPEELDAMVNVFARKLSSNGLSVSFRFTDDKRPVLVLNESYRFRRRGSKSLLS